MNRGLAAFWGIFFIGFISCQRELHFDYSNLAEGTLKSNITGDCLPATVSGTYKAGSATGNNNYIDVELDVTLTGTYQIQSDTINGYSFNGSGIVTTTGANIVRITSTGNPIHAGIDLFTIRFGNSACRLNIPVLDSTGNALFMLGGSPTSCSGFTVTGSYKEGSPLNINNTADLTVNVITAGPYTVTTTSINGMTFSAAGTFTQTGTQHISLIGTGIPVTAGNFNLTASNGYSNCTYTVTVDNAAPAIYTLGGAPGSCTGAVIAGNYVSGIPLTASNTATINVNVTGTGSYTISTLAANAVTFSNTGFFNSTGLQTVVLSANGTPASVGTINHIVSGGGSSCTFSVSYLAVPPVANYTLSGNPGNCSQFILNGGYTVAVPLTALNTLVLEVDVISTGSYICNTAVIDGIAFHAAGIFTSTGIQHITLSGTGTPLTAGTFSFTPQTSIFSVCRFDLTVSPPSSDVIKCKINGVLINFNTGATAALSASPATLLMTGNASPGSNEKISLKIGKTAGTITAGTYTDADLASGISLLVDYDDPSLNSWQAVSGSPTPFTIIITFIDGVRAQGTFSGTLKDNNGAGPNSKTITEGVFDVPVN